MLCQHKVGRDMERREELGEEVPFWVMTQGSGGPNHTTAVLESG